ncbi:MAG: GNAT family N-acetyltransferase [Gammaproteobacteria bacterium]|nr:GNAT family N-acetyltransferase [Gammaproteobacteria bacterium]
MDLLTPVTLTGAYATLIPLSMTHCSALTEGTKDGELWNLWYATVPSPENMENEIQRRLDLHAQGIMLPFTVIDNATQQPIGMTTYYKVDVLNRRCDIGWTWYRKSAQKTAINTECKLMLLTHAFETLNCIAVTLTANAFNLDSRRAIERLGAKLDGILRNLRIMKNGVICDYYQYSIINSEWVAVKANLQYKLGQFLNHPDESLSITPEGANYK